MSSGPATPTIETDGTNFPVCPACGTKDMNWYESAPRVADHGSKWDKTCMQCGAAYEVLLTTSVSFYTELKK